ncbi:para-nitrobenzyl esterase [Arthrobacter sp. UYP6]|uniref:carboxylesterase/lipase family protein n=1 Tax=Arthrobacter sp. UYP6 TaxID=1756378 RepID=UPI00339252B2
MTIDVTSLLIPTENGLIRGTVANGVRTWRGIPYAAPPVGELRLRSPQLPQRWNGVLDGSAFGAAPPQSRNPSLTGSRRRAPMDEDCLTLNVSAPLEPEFGQLPVLVYFYGGAFSSGSSTVKTYRGSHLVRTGEAVYVSLNYRIGALGFMDFSTFSAAGRAFDSNLGLRDQVAALEWVRDNISDFGGDPRNVTIFGESAGGISVTSLMCIPAARGLFHRAYAQSAAPSSAYSQELHASWARDLLQILKVPLSDAADALSTLPAEVLVRATNQLTSKIGPADKPGSLSVSPVVDGDFLPEHPLDTFMKGLAAPVPLVLGTMAREGALFAKMVDILPSTPDRIEKMFAGTDPEAQARVLAAYPGYPSRERSVEISGDLVFWYPSTVVAESHSLVAPTWSYRYDFATPLMNLLGFGATHAMDVPVMFGETREPITRALSVLGGAAALKELSARFQGTLLSLAKTGSPGPDWPRYEPVQRHTRIFDVEDRVESDPFPERRRAWAGYRGYL